jgi:hypothetical protein
VSDDPRARLEEAGRRPAPPPDPAFADRLEARLLAVAGTAPSQPEPGGPRRSRGRRRRLLVLAGASIGALAVVLVLTVGVPNGAPQPAPELAAPVNVQVALSDGTVLEDPDGLRLPEGAVVTVGDGGSARIGDTVLRPGDVATIEQGRVHVENERPIGVVTGTASPSPRPDAPRTPGAPRRTPSPHPATPAPTTRGSPPPSDAPVTPTPSPSPKPPPTQPPATPEPGSSTPPPTATPTPAPVYRTARPRLRARLTADGVKIAVRWTETRRARSYVLLVTRSRFGAAPDPAYPGSRVLGTFAHPPAVAFRFRVPEPVIEVRLLVVALGRHGTEVSRSRIVVVSTGGG